jgi:hypothetical protein
MSQFKRLGATLGLQHGQPPPPAPAKGVTHSRLDRNGNYPLYAADHCIFTAKPSRPNPFDDNGLCRSLRTHGPTFTADNTFPEFRGEYIDILRDVYLAFLEMLVEATLHYVLVNTAYRNF